MYYQRPTKKKNYSIEEIEWESNYRIEARLTLNLEDNTHLWVKTPQGTIKLFIGKNYRSITSWVEETVFTGFYKNGASKKTQLRHQRTGGTNMIQLKGKEVNE